jgi:hypothetical protein
MPEDAAVVAVPPAPVVAVPPELLNQPVDASDLDASGGADAERLRIKLNLANSQARDAKNEAAATRKQLAQLQADLENLRSAAEAGAAKQLEDQGQFKQLWQDAKGTITQRDQEILELKAQLSNLQQSAEQDRLRAAAIQEIGRANALVPEQLYGLLQPALRVNDEGQPVVLAGGAEVPLGDHLANLRNPGAGWVHHFAAGQARGMGAPAQGGVSSVAPGLDNPYRSGNFTAAFQLETTNPELAAALKAEAMRG